MKTYGWHSRRMLGSSGRAIAPSKPTNIVKESCGHLSTYGIAWGQGGGSDVSSGQRDAGMEVICGNQLLFDLQPMDP